jgi:hypothetical protein
MMALAREFEKPAMMQSSYQVLGATVAVD